MARQMNSEYEITFHLLKSFLLSIPDAIVISNGFGRIIMCNSAFEEMFGWTLDELQGIETESFPIVSSEHKLESRIIFSSLRSGEKLTNFQTIRIHKNGKAIPVSATFSCIHDLYGNIFAYASIYRNRTEMQEMHAANQELQDRYRLIVDNMSDQIGLLDKQGVFHFHTRESGETSPSSHHEASLFDNIHPLDLPHVKKEYENSLAVRKPFLSEFRLSGHSSDYNWMEAEFSPIFEGGVFKHMLVVTRDITRRKKLEEHNFEIAYYDNVTMLPNQRLFTVHLNEAVRLARLHRLPLTLLYLSVEADKELSPDVYNEAIQEISDRLKSVIGTQGMIGQQGKDEFIALLDDPGPFADLEVLAQELTARVNAPMTYQEGTPNFLAFLGIAVYSEKIGDATSLMEIAQMSMYQAREKGGNSYIIYTGE